MVNPSLDIICHQKNFPILCSLFFYHILYQITHVFLVHTILYFYSPQSVKKKKKEKKADLEPADFDNLAPYDFITDDEALLDPAIIYIH